jgi:hypothetical protein
MTITELVEKYEEQYADDIQRENANILKMKDFHKQLSQEIRTLIADKNLLKEKLDAMSKVPACNFHEHNIEF